MSPITHELAAGKLSRSAPIFAAIGDATRLSLLLKLSRGSRCSISQLAQGSTLTRQAITKHLRVLQRAGLVRGVRRGRENLFQLQSRSLHEARNALDRISRQWDEALARLETYVEK